MRELRFAIENYLRPLEQFRFGRYLTNSVVVTTLGGTITAALCTGQRPSSVAVHATTGDLYVASAGDDPVPNSTTA